MKKYNYRGTNVKNSINIERFDKKIEESSKRNARGLEEKGYSAELVTRGVKSFFEEYFEKNPLEDQYLSVVGPFEDIKVTESFQIGRERGAFLVENGYTENLYYEKYLPEFEEKYGRTNSAKKRG